MSMIMIVSVKVVVIIVIIIFINYTVIRITGLIVLNNDNDDIIMRMTELCDSVGDLVNLNGGVYTCEWVSARTRTRTQTRAF